MDDSITLHVFVSPCHPKTQNPTGAQPNRVFRAGDPTCKDTHVTLPAIIRLAIRSTGRLRIWGEGVRNARRTPDDRSRKNRNSPLAAGPRAAVTCIRTTFPASRKGLPGLPLPASVRRGEIGTVGSGLGVFLDRWWSAEHKGEWVEDGPPRRLGYHGPMTPAAQRLWYYSVKSWCLVDVSPLELAT